MIAILIAGTVFYFAIPLEWEANPRIRPWARGFVFLSYLVFISVLLIDGIFKVDLLGM